MARIGEVAPGVWGFLQRGSFAAVDGTVHAAVPGEVAAQVLSALGPGLDGESRRAVAAALARAAEGLVDGVGD